ncbi:Rieske (2Fe-2S) protein [Streptomyces sp. NPDC057694]|uniref:Rieske (2Fe-2S) protein n=1 Tax=Streptomyces sp. NPDC057694 TaxID=3346216 RepID=UPI0036868825
MKSAVDRYVEHLLGRRRPRPFAPSQEDLAITRTAIELLAESPDAAGPREEFVQDLRRRIAALDAAAEPITPDPTKDEPGVAELPAPRRAAWRAPGRRRFLAATALAATGAAAGAAVDRALTAQPPGEPGAKSGQITPTRGTWQNVASSTDVAEGAVFSFDLGTVTGFLRRTSGRVQAVSGICTHQACRLALSPARDTLACPCHGATFALTGESLIHPKSVRPLPSLPRMAVREIGGHIQVYAPAPTDTSALGV